MSDLFSSFETIQKLADKNSNRSEGSSVPLLYIYWSSKPGEDKDKIIRFLHEGCISVPFHEMVTTQTGKKADAVCLNATMIENQRECPLCSTDNVAKDRGMGLAVVREEKIEGEGPSRKAVVRDKYAELEDFETKAKFTQPYLGTIKQGMNNFWSSMTPISLRYGEVTSRDLQVTRVGSGTSTSYSFLPFDVDPELDTIDKVLARYEKVMQGKSPQELILQRLNQKSSDGYYKKQFGPTIFSDAPRLINDSEPTLTSVPTGGGLAEFSSATTSNPGPQNTTFADLRSKLQSYSSDDAPF